MDPTNACNIAAPFIFGAEGCSLTAYLDKLAKPPIYTIGHGTTRVNGSPVTAGMTCTLEQANAWAASDIAVFAHQVLNVVKVPLNDNQLAALTSFTYNEGIGSFGRSSALTALNGGDYSGCAAKLLLWDVAGGVVVAGLLARRKREAALFMQPVVTVAPVAPVTAPGNVNAGVTQAAASVTATPDFWVTLASEWDRAFQGAG